MLPTEWLTPRRLAQASVGAFVLLALASASGVISANAIGALPGLCLFHRLTGWDCPGCGIGRALFWLARGDVRRSVAFHPAAPVLLAWGIAWSFLPVPWIAAVGRSRVASVVAPALGTVALLVWWSWRVFS